MSQCMNDYKYPIPTIFFFQLSATKKVHRISKKKNLISEGIEPSTLGFEGLRSSTELKDHIEFDKKIIF